MAKLATGGAWLFAVGSLFPLLWLISDGGADGAVFQTHVDGTAYTIPLLTYSGGIGMLLIWAEILAIAGAFILTAAPRVPIKLAKIGHVVLLAWSALWTLGTWRLAAIAPGFWTVQALFLSVLAGCTAWRAWVNWSPRGSSSPTPPKDQLQAEPNFFAESSPPKPLISDSTRQQIVDAMEQARAAAVAASRKVVIGVKAGVAAARNHDART